MIFENNTLEMKGIKKLTNGIVYKNGTPIEIPICRRCQEQPKCSKMPYLEEY